jgi:hypothetical protein
VMLVGLPCGALAAVCPPLADVALTLPELGTRWVMTVARLGEVLQPAPGAPTLLAWVLSLAVLLGLSIWHARRARVRH